MRILIRQVTRRDGDALEYRDTEFFGEEITIGRAPDQDIILAGSDVSLRHARIRQRGGEWEVARVGTGELRIQGSAAATSRIELGDEIQIGAHRARRVVAPAGFDLALEVEIVVGIKSAWSSSMISSESTNKGWGKRRWSWVLGILFLSAGLVVPLVGVYVPPLQKVLRAATVLPSDHWWNSGPLIPAHSTPPAGQNCTACHRVPFLQVSNNECGACHRGVTRHAATDTEMGSKLASRRCAECHQEHSGPRAIVRRDSGFCVDCHGKLTRSLGDKTKLDNVRDFAEHHPEFRLTFLRAQKDLEGPKWVRVRLTKKDPAAREHSNLLFNHKVHLDPEGVDSPDGKKRLTCASCHQPDAGGVAMRPIGMKEHCSACHTLQFESVSLPHGSVEQALNVLRGYYRGSRASSDVIIREDVMVSRRREARRPGEEPVPVMANTPEERVERASRDVFDRTLCFVCHGDMRKNASEPQREALWQAAPVRLNQAWMPLAHFSHKSHVQSECVDCHGAETSKKSEDVLMPDIQSCRKCHAGSFTTSGLQSRCVDCHWFHLPGNSAWTPKQNHSAEISHGKS